MVYGDAMNMIVTLLRLNNYVIGHNYYVLVQMIMHHCACYMHVVYVLTCMQRINVCTYGLDSVVVWCHSVCVLRL